MRKTIEFIRCYIQAMDEDEVPVRAAALAYYAVFSLFPLLLLISSAVGFLLVEPERQQQVLDALIEFFPAGQEILVGVVQNALTGVVDFRTLTGVIAIIGLIWAASGFFRGLEVSIHHIFGTGRRRAVWKSRGIGMIMALLILPLLLFAVALSTLSSRLLHIPNLPDYAVDLLSLGANYGITLLIITVAFFLLFRFVPSGWTPVRPAIIGAFISAMAWSFLTLVFNWYLNSDFASFNVVYGSIGTLFALILYLYLMNFIILLGAELTAQFARTKECDPPPLPDVVEQFIESQISTRKKTEPY